MEIINKLKQMLAILQSLYNDPRIKLLMEAQRCIGQKLSPDNTALGCVTALSELHLRVFGKKIGETSSTIKLRYFLDNDRSFVRVYNPIPGDVILSVTGTGNGKISNGHCGIILTDNKIVSNSSFNGRWTINYTVDSWKERFGFYGGMITVFYRKII